MQLEKIPKATDLNATSSPDQHLFWFVKMSASTLLPPLLFE